MRSKLKSLLIKATPAIVRRAIQHDHEWICAIEQGAARLSYSQQAEDLVLEGLLSQVKNGFYVDIGAFHPVRYSNTRRLYDSGWCGINVEPNPDAIAEFVRLRPRDKTLNVGVGSQRSTMTYYAFNHGAINTFSQERAREWASKEGFSIKAEKRIDILPLRDIFAMYAFDRTVDLLSIDCEGLDFEVLQSNDWQMFRPRIVMAECDGLLRMENFMEHPIYRFMVAEQKYSLCNIVGVNMIFRRTHAGNPTDHAP